MSGFTGRPLEIIPLNNIGIYYSNWNIITHYKTIGIQLDCFNCKDVNAEVSFEIRAHDRASPCLFQTGGATLIHKVQSSTGIYGNDGVLTFVSKSTDVTGDETKIYFLDTVDAGDEYIEFSEEKKFIDKFGDVVSDRFIYVNIKSGVTTADTIKTLFDNHNIVKNLIDTTVTTSGTITSGVVDLDGGSVFFDFLTSAPQVRIKVEVITPVNGAFIRPFVVAKT